MTGKVIPFNPLDKKNLGASVAEALLTKEVHPLGDLPVFEGGGDLRHLLHWGLRALRAGLSAQRRWEVHAAHLRG